MGNTTQGTEASMDTCLIHANRKANLWCSTCGLPVCSSCKADLKNRHFNHQCNDLEIFYKATQEQLQIRRNEVESFLDDERRSLQALQQVERTFAELEEQAQKSLKAEEQALIERLNKVRNKLESQNHATSDKYLKAIDLQIQIFTSEIEKKEDYVRTATESFEGRPMAQWLTLRKEIESHQSVARSKAEALSLSDSLGVELRKKPPTLERKTGSVPNLNVGALSLHFTPTVKGSDESVQRGEPNLFQDAEDFSADEGSVQYSVGGSSTYGSNEDLAVKPTIYEPLQYQEVEGSQLTVLSAKWVRSYNNYDSNDGPHPGPVDFCPDGDTVEGYFVTSSSDADKLWKKFNKKQKGVPIPRVSKEWFKPMDVFVVAIVNPDKPPNKRVATNIYAGSYNFPARLTVRKGDVVLSSYRSKGPERNIRYIFTAYQLKHFDRLKVIANPNIPQSSSHRRSGKPIQ